MNVPPCPQVDGYPLAESRGVVERALAVGGADLVIDALRRLPGVVVDAGGTGRFRSTPPSVQIGTWRYQPDRRGRTIVAHVVGGIVLAEEAPPVPVVAEHIAAVLALHLGDVGDGALPDVLAMLEGLTVASA